MSKPRPRMTLEQLEQHVASQIADRLEADGMSFLKMFATPNPPQNGITGHIYRGTNFFTTAVDMMLRSTDDPRYLPRSAIFGLNPVGKLRKGERGTPILISKVATSSTRVDANGDPETYRLNKLHYVWHVSQLDDVDFDRLRPMSDMPTHHTPAEIDADAKAFIDATGARINTSSGQAFYRPSDDAIYMPPVDAFFDHEQLNRGQLWLSVCLHELIHWTGAKARLDRDLARYRFIEHRAFEELIAEIGSCMASVQLGLSYEPRADNVAYCASWLQVIKERPRAVFQAASEASKALAYLNSLQPEAASAALAAE